MQDAADRAPIIDRLLVSHVAWQMWFNSRLLLIVKPEQIFVQLPCSLPAQNL